MKFMFKTSNKYNKIKYKIIKLHIFSLTLLIKIWKIYVIFNYFLHTSLERLYRKVSSHSWNLGQSVVFFKTKNSKENFHVINLQVLEKQTYLCPRISVDSFSMNSTITIGDTDEEVIDLESSQDTTSDANNGQSECSTEKNKLSNTANWTDAISENVEYKTPASTSQTCDNTIYTSKPFFKVMFRDKSISRWEIILFTF